MEPSTVCPELLLVDVERWHPESNASFSPKYLGPNLLLFSEMERSRTVLIADVDCTVPLAAFREKPRIRRAFERCSAFKGSGGRD